MIMKKKLLGLVSIGQSPRQDYIQAFKPYAPDAEIRVVGALDGKSRDEIDRLAQQPTAYPLLTRLTDGDHVEIDLTILAPLVAVKSQELAQEGAGLVVVMCTGGFPEVVCDTPVLLPGKMLPAVVGALSRTRRVGVVTPTRDQVSAALTKWKADGFEPIVTWAAPHVHSEIARAAKEMADPDVEVVVLDCMGHDESYRIEFALLCGRPTVLAQSLVARVAGEWV